MPVSIDRLRKELETGRQAKRQRVQSSWIPNDEMYNGIVPKYSKLPYNFFIPILSGFEDTLIAKIDDAPLIRFGSGQPGEARMARMYDALWRTESEKPDSDYAMADLVSKRHAARYGRAFLKVVGSKKPFRIDVLAIDPYDMVTDPNGGGDLEDHRFVIQDGIFRSKKQLLDGADSGLYDKKAVAQILAGPGDNRDEYKTESDTTVRWSSLSQSGYGFDCAGELMYRLCEHVTIVDGVRMMVTWSPESGIILYEGTLKERYGVDLLPWTSWAPFYDSKVFWSKAPDDDIRQAAEATRVTIMEMMTNVQKKNWATRVYDPERISADQLAISAPNGLVVAKPGSASMPGGLEASFRIIQTPDVQGTASIIEFLDRFVGQKSGVTPDAMGTSGEDVLGIYQGNIAQVADRMGLQSRWYRNCWRRIATRFLYQAKRNLTGKVPVTVIGAKGAEMEVLMARNVNPETGITVTGGSAEAAVSEAKRKERGNALGAFLANPATAAKFNEQAAITEGLKAAGFEEDEIRLMLNKDAGSEYRDQQLRAAEAVEKLLEGDKPPLYYGATTVFVQSVLDSAKAYTDGDGPEHERLIAFAKAHIKIAAQNAAIAAQEAAVRQMLSAPPQPLQASAQPQEVALPPEGMETPAEASVETTVEQEMPPSMNPNPAIQ